MAKMTSEQKRQHAAHLRKEAMRLRESNPEQAERARKMAVFLELKAKQGDREK